MRPMVTNKFQHNGIGHDGERQGDGRRPDAEQRCERGLAVVVIIAMFPSRVSTSLKELSEGAKNAILPCFTTAAKTASAAMTAP